MKRIELDAETREALVGVTREAYELYNEVYVSSKELCQQISMFSEKWLERYGWKLPRERIEVKDDGGVVHSTRFGYPIHRIKRMIAEGKMREM